MVMSAWAGDGVDLTVDVRIEGRMAFVTPAGEIDVYTAPKLREVLIGLFANTSPKICVVDMERVEYLDSTGMGVLVGGLKRAWTNGSDVVLILKVNERIMKQFRISGLTKVFPMYGSADEVRADKRWVTWERSTDAVLDEDDVVIGFPLWIYVNDWELAKPVTTALDRVVEAFDLEIVYSSRQGARSGREVGARRRNGTLPGSASATEQSAPLRAALEGVDGGLTRVQLVAADGLMACLRRASAAVVQVGSLMIVKFDGHLEVRNLTQPELRHWFEHEDLKMSAASAMATLCTPPTAAEMRAARSERSRAAETIEIIGRGWYVNDAGTRVSLGAGLDSVTVRTPDESRKGRKPKEARPPVKIEVIEASTLRAAARVGGGPLVLNFAAPAPLGGGFTSGDSAQETSLMRASTLHLSLRAARDFYASQNASASPLYNHDVAYSPVVRVFRDDTGAVLARPYKMSVLSAVAPVARGAGPLLRERLPQTIDDRIKHILAVAEAHGHRTLVLGAWGCGGAGNDPALVAEAFRKHLANHSFDRVVFAVVGEPALSVFRTVFRG